MARRTVGGNSISGRSLFFSRESQPRRNMCRTPLRTRLNAGGEGRTGSSSNLYFPDAIGSQVGKPEGAVRPERYQPGFGKEIGAGRWDGELLNHVRERVDLSNAAVQIRKPQFSIRTESDAERLTIDSWDGELLDGMGERIDFPNLAAEIGKPQVAVQTEGNVEGCAIGRGEWEFANGMGERIDLTNRGGAGFGKPEVAVQTQRDAKGAAARCGYWKLMDGVREGIDLSNLVAIKLSKPQVAVQAGGDADGGNRTIGRWGDGELLDGVRKRVDLSDAGSDSQIGKDGIGKPQVAVRTRCDPQRKVAGGAGVEWELLNGVGVRVDFSDVAAAGLGEPEIAIRTTGNSLGATTG